MMSSIAHRRDLRILVVESPNLRDGFFLGDVQCLQQILLNLLSNAVKFTNYGDITIEITEIATGGGPVIRFAVSDTGIGIEPAHMDRLFQRFSQVDGSVSRKYGGTGLGLAICQRIVERYGGRMWAEGRPGDGATLHFTVRSREAH